MALSTEPEISGKVNFAPLEEQRSSMRAPQSSFPHREGLMEKGVDKRTVGAPGKRADTLSELDGDDEKE